MPELNIPHIYHNTKMVGYGGDQDWFADVWAQKAGCASVLGSNLYGYYVGITRCFRADFIKIMVDLYSYMTPGKMGFPYFYKFAHAFCDRMEKEGICLKPRYLKNSKSVKQSLEFVRKAIDNGHPVGVLVLSHRAPEMKEDNWHWVCITGYNIDADGADIIFSDCGDRRVVRADVFFDPWPANIVKLVSFKKA